MKSGKSRLITIMFAFIICIGTLSFGVYAAVTATLNASGTVTFNAYGIDVDVDGSITGAIGTGITTTYSGTTNKIRQPSKNLISSTPWNFGNLEFDDATAMDISEISIKLEMIISNYSNFAIEANVTVPSISGLNITKKVVNYSGGYNSQTGADQKVLSVTLQPFSLELPVILANLSLTINIGKTLNEAPVPSFTYGTPQNGEVGIAKFVGKEINVEIPSQDESGNIVTKIEASAFQDCTAVESVLIPESIKSIGAYAFNGCSALTSVNIPEGVTIIEQGTFSGCTKLTNVIIPSSVIRIGEVNSSADGAFQGCESITNIIIPESVTSIGYSSFRGCNSLINLMIPESVTIIGTGIVYYCRSLKNFAITNPLTKIDGPLFDECKSLQEITINFNMGAFQYNLAKLFRAMQLEDANNFVPASLKKVTVLGDNISEKAFYNCSKIENIVIKKEFEWSFANYFGWDSNKVEELFYGCSSLSEMSIAFKNDANITFPADFFDEKIPPSLRKITVSGQIPHNFIDSPNGLTTIVIDSSVDKIGYSAFNIDSQSITSVYIERTTEFSYLGDGCFIGLNDACKFYVKNNTVKNQLSNFGISSFQLY